jgi:hypothetical protein
MANTIKLNPEDVMKMAQLISESATILSKGMTTVTEPEPNQVSPLAAYLLVKAGYENLSYPDGTPISKSDIDEITLDFTRGRTLSEEEAEIQLNFILDKSPYLRMFNSRIVKKLVTPIEAKAITKKNLISYEQNGATTGVTVNRRIVHNFGIDLYLRHVQLQKDIPLQTVIDNLHNPGWEQGVLNDVAIALANDILLLVMNGLGGAYSSTRDFYDLNKGFVKILQDANGANTNTQGNIVVSGFLGKYLTPHKVDATTVADSYTQANILALLRTMWKRMPAEHRNNPNNVWMMSQSDLDLYTESRSDMTSPSNVTREQNLTNGITPNFMGRNVIALPDMISINETHEGNANVHGCIIFGDPKNIDVASDKSTYLQTMDFNARGTMGPVFEYTYDIYLDVQVARCDSFVIAYKGAKVETPYFVTAAGALTGSSGLIATVSANTYNASVAGGDDGDNLEVVPYCDTVGAVILTHTSTLNASYATAVSAGATVVPQGKAITLNADAYFRAYMLDGSLITSTEIFFNKTL